MDLTKITTPFGLLDKETQDALKAHGGLVEWFDGYRWIETKHPLWHSVYVYRVKPEPPKPREWWIKFDPISAMCFQRDGDDPPPEGMGYTRVREVLE